MRKLLQVRYGAFTRTFRDEPTAKAVAWFLQDAGLSAELLPESYHINEVPVSDTVVRAIQLLYKEGHKVTAIKLARDLTRCGLKEGKDFCDMVFNEYTPGSF